MAREKYANFSVHIVVNEVQKDFTNEEFIVSLLLSL